jgi:hypothetical protein
VNKYDSSSKKSKPLGDIKSHKIPKTIGEKVEEKKLTFATMLVGVDFSSSVWRLDLREWKNV